MENPLAHEYLLMLTPHEDLCNRIIAVKKEFSEKYKMPQAFYSKPTIALVKYSQLQLVEARIVKTLQIIARAYHPFKVDLRNFSSYPSHTIFINIDSRQQVKNLIKEIRPAQRLMKLDEENKPHFMDNPNIAIAQKLKPWQYEQAWLDYSQRHFTGSFMANAIHLLKRNKDEKAYKEIHKFEFMNLSVTAKQGDLFM